MKPPPIDEAASMVVSSVWILYTIAVSERGILTFRMIHYPMPLLQPNRTKPDQGVHLKLAV